MKNIARKQDSKSTTQSRFGLHFQFWKCWLDISTVSCWALNQTEVLEPQDPKPFFRASSLKGTPQKKSEFGLGASLKMPNLHDLKNESEGVRAVSLIRLKNQEIAFESPKTMASRSQPL